MVAEDSQLKLDLKQSEWAIKVEIARLVLRESDHHLSCLFILQPFFGRKLDLPGAGVLVWKVKKVLRAT